MIDANQNYEAGSLWRTRQDIDCICEDGKQFKIKRNQIILILKIVEEFNYTHLKLFYKNKIYYCLEIEDVGINFFYNEKKVLNEKS